ncbi:MAG: patatin-like phospholipase family protein [Devosiaceae bacterium]|nr:patatin-like phospholipase family protein [Devosiaceae bacterium MH13]
MSELDGLHPNGAPSIGLALGGGAARGWAHIGVLQVLAEAGIVPDVIAGTSIGALAGGAFASGQLGPLEAFARSLTPRRVFALADLSLLSSGLIVGKRIDKKLKGYFDGMTIEGLPTRLVVIATELSTGHEIWLRRGDLMSSMKASFAMPGVFRPVMHNGRALVDGALVNPVPISVCRAYGARLIIAVSLSPENMPHGTVQPDLPDFDDDDGALDDGPGSRVTELLSLTGKAQPVRAALKHQFGGSTEKPRGIPAVMMQSFSIIQDRMTRSRMAGDPPDVLIEPYVGGIGLFDFHKAEQGIEAGRVAATRALDNIAHMTKRLSLRPATPEG